MYRVTNDAGRTDLSIQRVFLNGSDTNFKLLEAYTLNSGKKSSTTSTSVKISALDLKTQGLTNYKQITVPFDSVKIGSNVHFKYQLIRKPILKTIFSDTRGFSSSTLAKTEFIKYTSDIPLHVLSEKFDDHFEVLQNHSAGKYFVTVRPTPKAYSLLGIVQREALIYISTAKSWKDLREGLSPLYKKEWDVHLPEKLENITRLLKPSKDRSHQIEKVAEEIKKLIAYSGDWTTQQGRFQPSNLKKTLFRGKGDCKDFSTVMTAMLRDLGYEAYPLLTFRSETYLGESRIVKMAKMPNLGFFNHAIVWAKDPEGKVWWVDPTNSYVKSDVITSDILGNFGLLLDEKTTDILFLPKTNLQPSDFKFEHHLTLQAGSIRCLTMQQIGSKNVWGNTKA